jgi:RNase P/RNase MRP subunit p30
MRDLNLFRTKDSIYLIEVSTKDEALSNLDCDGFLIRSSEGEARKIIQSLKGSNKKIAVMGGDDAFNRRVLETLKIDYLVSPEGGNKFDNLKQRDSGLNHVVARIAQDKGVEIVISMREVSRLECKDKALRLGRIRQNILICRRAACGLKIASLGVDMEGVVDWMGRRAFGVSLGMSSVESRDCVEF